MLSFDKKNLLTLKKKNQIIIDILDFLALWGALKNIEIDKKPPNYSQKL